MPEIIITGTRKTIETGNGITPYRNVAVTNTAVEVRATEGQTCYVFAYNPGTLSYLHIYNLAVGSVTTSTTPLLTIPLPAGGGGFADTIVIPCSTAITIAVGGTAADRSVAPGSAAIVGINHRSMS
jgi:hypothetical protein